MKRKNSAARKFCPTINFDLMINFDFFDLITWIPSWYEREIWFVDVS